MQIMGSGSASTQSRLIDYLVVVGVRKPTVDSTETRLLLRRFPQKDHKDGVSPGDVVFFVNWKDVVLYRKSFLCAKRTRWRLRGLKMIPARLLWNLCFNIKMCFDLVRALFTRKKRLQRKNSNCAEEVSTQTRFLHDFCIFHSFQHSRSAYFSFAR